MRLVSYFHIFFFPKHWWTPFLFLYCSSRLPFLLRWSLSESSTGEFPLGYTRWWIWDNSKDSMYMNVIKYCVLTFFLWYFMFWSIHWRRRWNFLIAYQTIFLQQPWRRTLPCINKLNKFYFQLPTWPVMLESQVFFPPQVLSLDPLGCVKPTQIDWLFLDLSKNKNSQISPAISSGWVQLLTPP